MTLGSERSSSARQWFTDTVVKNQNRIDPTIPTWLTQAREKAVAAVNRLPVPETKHEVWRYTDFTGLYRQTFLQQNIAVAGLTEGSVTDWIYPAGQSYRLVFANGRFVPALSLQDGVPDTVKIGSLHDAIQADAKSVATNPNPWLQDDRCLASDIFSELNRALTNDGLYVRIPGQVKLERPIEVVYLNLANEHAVLAQPRSLVILEPGATATLIERFEGSGQAAYFFNALTDIQLQANTQLHHYRLQNESRRAHHLSRVNVQLNNASNYKGVCLATGGVWSRAEYTARFVGEHAVCDLSGLYTVGLKQYTDIHLDIRHEKPNNRSRENFRGIIAENGRAVFDGRILVEKDAQKTDAQLSNKNLLLGQDAQVNTKPQLEIYADDVKCSHGTSVGKIDPDQLFYLRSRGISETLAREMLCLGFAEQILNEVAEPTGEPRLRDFMQRNISSVLSQQASGE